MRDNRSIQRKNPGSYCARDGTATTMRLSVHGDDDAPQRGEGMVEARHDYLPVHAVEKTSVKLSPESRVLKVVHVHADKNLGGLKLLEGVLDAIGYVCGNPHLCVNLHVGTSGILLYLFK